MLGTILSSRLAEDYLYNLGKISNIHKEELKEKPTKSKPIVVSTLSNAYNQP